GRGLGCSRQAERILIEEEADAVAQPDEGLRGSSEDHRAAGPQQGRQGPPQSDGQGHGKRPHHVQPPGRPRQHSHRQAEGQPEEEARTATGSSAICTSPVSPSMLISAPSGISWVASAICTAGNPYSRASSEPWASIPPVSRTIPLSRVKTGVHPGSVLLVIRMSPSLTWPMSLRERITRARPVTWPRLVPTPLRPSSASPVSNVTGSFPRR